MIQAGQDLEAQLSPLGAGDRGCPTASPNPGDADTLGHSNWEAVSVWKASRAEQSGKAHKLGHMESLSNQVVDL